MKKMTFKNLEQDYYVEKLENGLEVYMIPYTNKKNYFISYATRFGSDVLEFTDEHKNTFTPPLGIAHFLEHKMFEQEDGIDPFTYFSKSGTDSNASTSFDNTQYICYGTKNFYNNLRYLLGFVNNPYYTKENVNKEKGIIAEEINMYDDIPDFKLEMTLRECLYKNHPRRIDIAGTVEEINKIEKEDLYACYNNFYIPNNMFILIVGNFDPTEALDIIIAEVGNKPKKKLPKIKKTTEPCKVYEKNKVVAANIEVPKIAYGLKLSTKNLKYKEIELDLYLNMLTTIVLGASSEFRERARQEKLLNSIYTEWETIEDYKTFYFIASSMNPDKLIEELNEEFERLPLKEETFNRIKKVWIANEVRMIDNMDATINNVYDDIIKYREIISNKIDYIKKMKIKELKEIVKQIDLKNVSIVKMISDKEKKI